MRGEERRAEESRGGRITEGRRGERMVPIAAAEEKGSATNCRQVIFPTTVLTGRVEMKRESHFNSERGKDLEQQREKGRGNSHTNAPFDRGVSAFDDGVIEDNRRGRSHCNL